MKSIAQWLIHIENLAGRFYHEAAAYFDDPDLVAFLEHSARDEERHADIMASAIEILQAHPEIKSAIRVDGQTRENIETPFQVNRQRLEANTLTRDQLIDGIIATEFSEWNEIFLYVVNALKAIDPQFKSAAASMQHHLKHMAHFLASSGYGQHDIEKIKTLGPVWTERILIIEDDPYLQELYEAVLTMEGQVDMAKDGEDGLEKISRHYYRLIVSDVTMPGLDGITVYRRMSDRFPGIGDRYLFLTGNPDPQIIAYFNTHNLKYLTKPASIHDIKCAALEILHDLRCN